MSTITIRDNGHGQDIGPAPQWTTTPPTEPGWYWYRVPYDQSELFIVQVVEDCVTHKALYIDGDCDVPLSIADFGRDFEWWPVRIEEPPR